MAFIVKGPAVCNKPGCGKCWDIDPVLLVPCPDCQAPVGVGCRRPSGHSGPFVELHAARDLLADREGVVYRHDFYKPEGFATFANSGRVKLLAESFQRMWDAGRSSLELRELPL